MIIIQKRQVATIGRSKFVRSCFIILLCISLATCASTKDMVFKDVAIYITNKKIKDGDTLKIRMINKSNYNYYFLLDSLTITTPSYKFFARNYLSRGGIVFKSSKGVVPIEIVDYECYDEYNQVNYIENANYNDVIKLKAKEEAIFSIKFNMKTEINPDCYYRFQTDSSLTKKNNFAYFKLYKTDIPLEQIISSKLIDSLHEMGYKLYNKHTNSNLVPVIFD